MENKRNNILLSNTYPKRQTKLCILHLNLVSTFIRLLGILEQIVRSPFLLHHIYVEDVRKARDVIAKDVDLQSRALHVAASRGNSKELNQKFKPKL